MRIFEKLALLALLTLGIYWAYQQPEFRPQMEQAWHSFLVLIRQTEEQLNQQVRIQNPGVGGPQSINVAIPISKAQDWQEVGTMGPAILGGSQPLKIEVDYTPSSKPTSTELNVISSTLSHYSGKTPQLSLDNSSLPVKENYSLQDIVDITQSSRSCYSSGSQVCLYLMYLPGKLANTTALGASYTSTAMVLFPNQFENAAQPFVSKDKIAQATETHELGHLFGLVGLTHPSARNHADTNHPGHSSNPRSVMYWAVEDTGILGVLGGGPPVNFDQDDEFDISQIKGGK